MAEISKRDIWCPQRVAQERPDVWYQLVAIDFLPPKVRQCTQRPVDEAFNCVYRLFVSKFPLPCYLLIFKASHIRKIFKYCCSRSVT